jgi:hypothetical protein
MMTLVPCRHWPTVSSWITEVHKATQTRFHRGARLTVGLALAGVLLGACASTPPAPPTTALAAARQAITSAEQSDARQYASAELDESRQRLAMAERAVTTESMIEAERYANESRAAAELASARTESAKAAEINREMSRGAEALREEMQRTGEQQ